MKVVYYPAPRPVAGPLIVFRGGYDTIVEELYFFLAAAATSRGYSVLTFDGPGQGAPLREQGLQFTPEWEKPTSAVLDAFLATHARPEKIVLIGLSMGGYLAPRAVPSRGSASERLGTPAMNAAGGGTDIPLRPSMTMSPKRIDKKRVIGGGGGSRTRVRKCYWSRDYMRSRVHAPGITLGRSRSALRTDKKRVPLA